jgi:hypothetical protein
MRHRFTSLALASSLFALVTGVAAWFWGQLFTSPAVDVADRGITIGTAVAAALMGAVAGLLLAPAQGDDMGPPRPSPTRVTFVVLVFGCLVGGLGAAQRAWGDVGLGIGVGFFCAIPLIPAAALAIAMVRRVDRARRGSVVARSDARGLVAGTAGIIGCFSGLAVFDWPAVAAGAADPPLPAVIVLVAAAALVFIVLIADVVALTRVKRWASSVAAEEGDGSSLPVPPVPVPPAGRLDLGLGDEIAAAPALGTAYRGGGRWLASITGDIDEARAALRQSIRRGVILVAVLEGVGFAHGVARDPELAAQLGAQLCNEGRPAACRSAALLAERAGLPRREAARLHGRACDDGQEESCLAVFLMQRLESPPW